MFEGICGEKTVEIIGALSLGSTWCITAWGGVRESKVLKDVIFKTVCAQKPLDFYVFFPYWRHYQKLSHILSLI